VSQARPSTALTPHEALIARFARDRLSNPEIGARPFVSLRTVEYHLHNVLTTLARRAQQRAFPAGRAAC
jgi:DNA-binding NarL/FixJ family response regulator